VFLVLGGAAAVLYRRFSWVSDDVS
jgi:hypothetical protein